MSTANRSSMCLLIDVSAQATAVNGNIFQVENELVGQAIVLQEEKDAGTANMVVYGRLGPEFAWVQLDTAAATANTTITAWPQMYAAIESVSVDFTGRIGIGAYGVDTGVQAS